MNYKTAAFVYNGIDRLLTFVGVVHHTPRKKAWIRQDSVQVAVYPQPKCLC